MLQNRDIRSPEGGRRTNATINSIGNSLEHVQTPSSYAQIEQLQVQGIALKAHKQFVKDSKKRYFEDIDVTRFGAWLSETETQYRWQARHLAHQKAVDICNYQVNKSDPDQGQLKENFMKFFQGSSHRTNYQDEKTFREQLAQKYHAGQGPEKKSEYWHHVLGKWSPHDRCRPVRLFPSRCVNIMDRIFGEGASKDISSAYNGLLTHSIIGRALDEGVLALIPVEFDDAKGYQVVVIDYWHDCLAIRLDRASPELGVTFLWELEGRMLSFRDGFRPKAQYMWWNYMSSAIAAAWRSKNTHGYYKSKIRVYIEDDDQGGTSPVKHSQFVMELGRAWRQACSGKLYVSDSILTSLVMIAGHHADPKIDDGFDPTKANHEAAAIIVAEQARRGIDDRDRELLGSKAAGESIGLEDWMTRKDNHKLNSRMLALKRLSIIAEKRRSMDGWYDELDKFTSLFETYDGAQVEGVSQEEAFAHIMCGAYCPNPPEGNQRWDPVLHQWGGFRVVRARHLCTPRHRDLLDDWIYDENTPEQWLSAQNGLFLHEDIVQGLKDGVLCIVPDVGVEPDEFGSESDDDSDAEDDEHRQCLKAWQESPIKEYKILLIDPTHPSAKQGKTLSIKQDIISLRQLEGRELKFQTEARPDDNFVRLSFLASIAVASWRKIDQRKRCRRVIDKQIQRACRHWGTWGHEILERFERDWLFNNDFLEAMIACERAYPGEHEVEKAEAEEAFKIFN
ncbi:hypothetical protein CGCF415_v004004 [Colletotrichum fructicola]|nr:hypothetical protein CGCF415_v004004 [Colletotrichum fructicola]KAF4939435.1 hypothetical protein CGCF245_v003586 [Colletotrichum fructicola]